MERFQFVDVSIGADVDDVEFTSALFSSELSASDDIDVDQSDCLKANQPVNVSSSQWVPKWLPPGFRAVFLSASGCRGSRVSDVHRWPGRVLGVY